MLHRPSMEYVNKHKIRPVNTLDCPEGPGLEVMDSGGEGLAVRPLVGAR